MDLIELVKEKGLEPEKTSPKNGGEYHCACPSPNCDADENGFMFWPNEDAGKCKGRYWCRKCGIKGDTIQFCVDYLGLGFKDACKKLNVAPSDSFKFQQQPAKPKQELSIAKKPNEMWQGKAKLLVDWSHQQLLKNPIALDKLYLRGFTDGSIDKFKLGYIPSDLFREYVDWGLEPEKKKDGNFRKLWLPQGLSIPWFDNDGNVLRINIRRDDEKITKEQDQKYIKVKGGMECPVIYGDISLPVCIILESEFDALLIQQFAGDLCFCIANSAGKPIDLYADHLIRKTSIALICPDVDKAGSTTSDKLYSNYKNSILFPSPKGKSAGDALKDHKINLREWILTGIPKALRNDNK